jgi:hypothetical protein
MPASIIIPDDIRRIVNLGQAIALLINSDFFYYDGEYSIGVTLLRDKELEIEALHRQQRTLLRKELPSLKWQLTQLKQIAS